MNIETPNIRMYSEDSRRFYVSCHEAGGLFLGKPTIYLPKVFVKNTSAYIYEYNGIKYIPQSLNPYKNDYKTIEFTKLNRYQEAEVYNITLNGTSVVFYDEKSSTYSILPDSFIGLSEADEKLMIAYISNYIFEMANHLHKEFVILLNFKTGKLFSVEIIDKYLNTFDAFGNSKTIVHWCCFSNPHVGLNINKDLYWFAVYNSWEITVDCASFIQNNKIGCDLEDIIEFFEIMPFHEGDKCSSLTNKELELEGEKDEE